MSKIRKEILLCFLTTLLGLATGEYCWNHCISSSNDGSMQPSPTTSSQGPPGKSGPQGINGQKGEKGDRGECSTDLERLRSVEEKVNRFEDRLNQTVAMLQQISQKLDVIALPKSCSSIPTKRNGFYWIRPSASIEKFQAFCDFGGTTPKTVINHNFQSEVEALPHCDPKNCYRRDIVYEPTTGVSMTQIRALVEHSTTCSQYIKYRCWNSVMRYGSWVSYDGSVHTYWTGSEERSGYCACGLTGTCNRSSDKCNCDKNTNEWLEDEGVLTNKDHLPIVQVRFGDLDGGERGFHTVGRLECID